MAKRYPYVPPQGSLNYDWSADHTFAKVAAEDTGGQYTFLEDNLKANFKLGLHLRYHTETFDILNGSVDLYVDGDWMTALPRTCNHVPPGAEHDREESGGYDAARILMIYQPSAFDQFLAELATMEEAGLEDIAKMAERYEKYDIVDLGSVPERSAA